MLCVIYHIRACSIAAPFNLIANGRNVGAGSLLPKTAPVGPPAVAPLGLLTSSDRGRGSRLVVSPKSVQPVVT